MTEEFKYPTPDTYGNHNRLGSQCIIVSLEDLPIFPFCLNVCYTWVFFSLKQHAGTQYGSPYAISFDFHPFVLHVSDLRICK